MRSPIPVQMLEVFKARLARITESNGYYSNAGAALYEGYLAEALASDERSSYPFIALQPGVDRRLGKSSGGRLRRQVEFHFVVVDRLDEGVTSRLLQHGDDVIHAVADRNNTDFVDGLALDCQVLDVEYNIPENGGPVAWAAVPVTADYQLILPA
ncbi:hypothetical protein [Alloalcanivorax xenomutans]|uniref:hypothetical protein n=1 Tax=Alloalcanivorax xenomutans TaxID=1094342 RepID=UPI001F170AC0|nr:hypothetical protein [Alloalcanivorax xenomutans]MCE7521961.1 hypothetical protein [Alloalcanivorax xenomutans]